MTGFSKATVTIHLDDGSQMSGVILKGQVHGPKTTPVSQFDDGPERHIVVEPAKCFLEIVNLQVIDREPITITPPKPARLPADAEDPAWGIF